MAKKSKPKNRKEARAAATEAFDFADMFDEAEKEGHLVAVEVTERRDPQLAIHSGSLVIDLVLLGGGYYAGRVYDWVGPEHGGKTTMGNMALAESMVWIPNYTSGYYGDAEGTLDTKWFTNIARQAGFKGTASDIFGKRDKEGNWTTKPRIRLVKGSFGEQYLQTYIKILNKLPDKVFMQDKWYYRWVPVEAKVAKKTGGLTAKTLKEMLDKQKIPWEPNMLQDFGAFFAKVPNGYGGPEGVLFTDSLIALTPRQTAEDDSAALAQHGRMFGRYINQIKGLVALKGWTMININQVRKNPGQMFGNPEYSPGGEAIKFVCDCRNRIAPCANPAGGGHAEIDGANEYRWSSIKNTKNKVYMPYGNAKIRWWTKRDGETGCGLDPIHDTMEYLDITGQITPNGRKGFYITLQDGSNAAKKLAEINFTYDAFCDAVLMGKIDTGKKVVNFSIRDHCKGQIKSGIAFDLYRGNEAEETESEEDDE